MAARDPSMGALMAFGSALAAATALLVGVLAQPASASNCALDFYNHNGSRMEVTMCDNGVWIHYDNPRQGMRNQGVQSGDLLVDGSWAGQNGINATARVFKRGCGVATYPVSGSVQGNRIVLYGQAPVRGGNGCSITRYRDDQLVFDLMPN
ncbi:MAG: hypothetical protein AAGD23_09460 [Pseudomonadota bacterium]